MMHRDEEIRPAWGESTEVLPGPEYDVQPRPVTRTLQEWREVKIADGLCPLPGCGGSLDADCFCSLCGTVSLPGVAPSDPDVRELPVYPIALTLDEYAEAQVDAA